MTGRPAVNKPSKEATASSPLWGHCARHRPYARVDQTRRPSAPVARLLGSFEGANANVLSPGKADRSLSLAIGRMAQIAHSFVGDDPAPIIAHQESLGMDMSAARVSSEALCKRECGAGEGKRCCTLGNRVVARAISVASTPACARRNELKTKSCAAKVVPSDRASCSTNHPATRWLGVRHEERSMNTKKLLSIRDVCCRLGISRSTLWRLTQQGDLPKPIRLSPNRVGIMEAELDEWLALRAAGRNSDGARR